MNWLWKNWTGPMAATISIVAGSILGEVAVRAADPSAKSQTVKAAAAPDPAKSVPSAPVAIFIAIEDYKTRLEYPVDSCIALAEKLRKEGYRILFVTEPKSHGKLVKAFEKDKKEIDEALKKIEENNPKPKEEDAAPVVKSNPKAAIKNEVKKDTVKDFEVVFAEYGPEIQQIALQWCTQVLGAYPVRPALGLMVVSGHGELRGENLYLLAKSGMDDVNVTSLEKTCSQKKLPLFLVLDTCQVSLSTDPKKVIKKFATRGIPFPERGISIPFEETVGPKDKDASLPVASVSACARGEVAPDKPEDLVRSLANSLYFDPISKNYVASYPFRNRSNLFRTEVTAGLTLEDWVRSGLTRYNMNEDSILTWKGGYRRSYLDLSQPMAVHRVSSESNPFIRMPSIFVQNLHGETESANSTHFLQKEYGMALRLTREKNADEKNAWGGWLLKMPVETKDKTLVIRAVSEGVKSFQVHAKSESGNTTEHLTIDDWNTTGYDFEKEPIKIFYLPLKASQMGKRLEVIGIQANNLKSPLAEVWPKGASLTFTDICLVDSDRLPAIPPKQNPVKNLLENWWHNDIPPGKLVQLKMDFAEEKEAKTIQSPFIRLSGIGVPKGQSAWRGGVISPDIFIPAKSKLEIKISSEGTDPGTKLEVELYSRGERVELFSSGERIDAVNIDLEKAAKQKLFTATVEIPKATSVDYLILKSNGKPVKVFAINSVPSK